MKSIFLISCEFLRS